MLTAACAKKLGMTPILILKKRGVTERKGNLAAMKTVGPQHELFIVTEGATVIRVKTDEISQTGRATQGVIVMRFKEEGDRVISMALTDREQDAEKEPSHE